MSGALAVGTAIRANFLSFARVLAASLARHHPELPFHVLLVDEAAGRFDPAGEPFEVVELERLARPGTRERLFRLDEREAVVAAKADVLAHLLDSGYESALFIDADIMVTGSLAPLLETVRRHAVTLTPHFLAPVDTHDRVERESLVLLAGSYNGGVIGLTEGAEARALLSWWLDRLATHCRHHIAEGMHYDQRWLDLVPGFFDDVHLFRDRAVNVAHWNLPERLREEVALFHFSGYRPDTPATVTHYTDRLALDDLGPVAGLFERYRAALLDAGWPETRAWAYAYGTFADGVPIPALARDLYAGLGEEERSLFGDPFGGGPGSFRAWLASGAPVPRLWQAVLDRRPDVRARFPDPGGADAAEFAAWAAERGARELGLDLRVAPLPSLDA